MSTQSSSTASTISVEDIMQSIDTGTAALNGFYEQVGILQGVIEAAVGQVQTELETTLTDITVKKDEIAEDFSDTRDFITEAKLKILGHFTEAYQIIKDTRDNAIKAFGEAVKIREDQATLVVQNHRNDAIALIDHRRNDAIGAIQLQRDIAIIAIQSADNARFQTQPNSGTPGGPQQPY